MGALLDGPNGSSTLASEDQRQPDKENLPKLPADKFKFKDQEANSKNALCAERSSLLEADLDGSWGIKAPGSGCLEPFQV